MSNRMFSCDFETTTLEDDCRVWAYACSEIGNPDNIVYGNSLDDFMAWCANSKHNYKCFFHNIKFDGCYIVEWLLANGYEFVADKKDRHDKSFTTLITDMGQWYQITVWFKIQGHHTNKVVFQDSLKILNFSVDAIAKGFNLPLSKLTLDYKAFREKGHELTPDEVEYIQHDVKIIALALDIMFKQGLNKMTIASDALSSFKKMCTNFRQYFPKLDPIVDADIRQSYKGGFTYVSEKYAGKEVGEGVVFDVNSLYPSRMVKEMLPFGKPEPFEGKYEPDPIYDLYVQKFSCIFELKPDKIPSIQIKHSPSFIQNEYLKSSNGQVVTLCLTNPDLELFFEQYDVTPIEWQGGYKFKSTNGLFDNYVDYWTQQKIRAKKEGNAPQYLISKLMLNPYTASLVLGLSEGKKSQYLLKMKLSTLLHLKKPNPVYIYQLHPLLPHMRGSTP